MKNKNQKEQEIKDQTCDCKHDENCACGDDCDCELQPIFDTENDLNVAVIRDNKELLVNQDCCTCINIMLLNDGRIHTSFLGSHNPYILQQLEKAQKLYFKGLKKALKQSYVMHDDGCECGCGCVDECHCDDDCDCGCNDGKECTCDDNCGCDNQGKKKKKTKKAKCNCSPDCTCGCQEGKDCTYDGECSCGDDCNCEKGTDHDCGCGGKGKKNNKDKRKNNN